MNLQVLILAIAIVCHSMSVTMCAKRVDAHHRARETLKKRRNQVTILQRRAEVPLDTSELFQLTKDESLDAERDATGAAGTITEKLKETYKGIEVYDTIVTVHKTKDGHLTGDASGELIQEIDTDLPELDARLSDEETLHLALNAEGDDIYDITNVNYKKTIYVDDDDRARLVNILSYLIDGEKRPFYIIDLQNGNILKHWQGLNSRKCRTGNYQAVGGNERTGKLLYGEKPYCLQPKVIGSKCYLENKYVRVIDMGNKSHSSNNDFETAHFDCDTGYKDSINGGFSPATDAFFHGSVVCSMFKDWFDSKPLKNKVVIRVHYGSLVENAFWDGRTCALGDGSDYLYPLTSLDILGHEIGHGVTEQASGLVYYGESGGVDEAFSDMIGEAAEDYLKTSDFMIGHDIMKSEPYLREFKEPSNDHMSIQHVKDMNESMDTHYSSGIYRRVWYVVVNRGMPIRNAAAVFLHANRMFWHSTSSFFDCSCGVLKAALDLGYDTIPFRKAFKDVGIDSCDVSLYVCTLSNNETRTDIQLSKHIHPVFKIETPPWADVFVVNVASKTEKEINITIMTGGWEMLDDNKISVVVVKTGVNSVSIKDAEANEFFIKVSLQTTNTDEDASRTSADITAGYSCQANYTPDRTSASGYKRDCKKRKKSRKMKG